MLYYESPQSPLFEEGRTILYENHHIKVDHLHFPQEHNQYSPASIFITAGTSGAITD
jgi:hypothetical protein